MFHLDVEQSHYFTLKKIYNFLELMKKHICAIKSCYQRCVLAIMTVELTCIVTVLSEKPDGGLEWPLEHHGTTQINRFSPLLANATECHCFAAVFLVFTVFLRRGWVGSSASFLHSF